jgi:integrase
MTRFGSARHLAPVVTPREPTIEPATADLYRYLLRKHIVPRFGPMPVGQITTVEVQAWLADRYRTTLSANSVAKAYRVLRGALDGAVDAGLIFRNPCTIKGAGTEREQEMQIATPEQVAALAAAVGPRLEALVFTAGYGGLRWGELAGLRRRDVDLDACTLSVTHKLGEVNGTLSDGPPKSEAGRRILGVPSFVARSLATHIDLSSLPGDDGLAIPSVEGTPMRRSNFRRRVWDPATAEVGMNEFRFHDLRHTAATLAAASGTSLKALMARIGHASAAAALRYQHMIDGQDADIVRYLERFARSRPCPQVPTMTRERPSLVGTQWARRPSRRRSRTGRKAMTSNFSVETMGLEPTTPCLQNRYRAVRTVPAGVVSSHPAPHLSLRSAVKSLVSRGSAVHLVLLDFA